MRNVVTVHTGPIRIHLNVSPWAGWTKDCQKIDRASRLRRKYVGTCSTTGCGHAGCSKSSSSKAAASEGPEAYPLGYVEGLNDARTKLVGFFSILLVEEGERL